MGVLADELRADLGEKARKMTEARLVGDQFSTGSVASGCGTCDALPPSRSRGVRRGCGARAVLARGCGEDAAAPAPGRCRLRSMARADAVTVKRAGGPSGNGAGVPAARWGSGREIM